MFTGIIEGLGKVTDLNLSLEQMNIELETPYSDLVLGESVAVNGVCLTVAEIIIPNRSRFFLSRETLNRTCFETLSVGSFVNLERALPALGRLSGHFVQGHIDGIGSISSLKSTGDFFSIEVERPKMLGRFCVEKGSIAIHGVSLTLNGVLDHSLGTRVSLCLIPHTYKNTVFQLLKAGSQVHIEIDILAKYMERLCTTPDQMKAHPLPQP